MQSKPNQFKQPNPHYPQFQQQSRQQSHYTQPQTYLQPQQQSFMPPQQQYQPQPQYQPPMKPPKKSLRKGLWILVAAVFVLAIILGVALRVQNQQTTSTTQAPQSTPTVQQPTSALASKVSTRSPIKQPSVESIKSQLQNIVQKSGAVYVGSAAVSYDTDFKYAHIVESLPVTGDQSLDIGRIKQDALSIQKAIWQAHVSGVDAVQINFNSDDATPHRLATCELERTTVAQLNWTRITSDQAWSDYDTTWLSMS